MNIWPLRFQPHGEGQLLFTDDSGGFFKADDAFLDRYASETLRESDLNFLKLNGHAFQEEGDTDYVGLAYRWAQRQFVPSELDYIILVPTLRCNLACGYCQVSRASESARGFDWTDVVADSTLNFLDRLTARSVKIEFQGGEPLLRLDLLERVRSFARARFDAPTFVVCTNLQSVDEAAWSFLESPDTQISTSLDGDTATHRRQRTISADRTAEFVINLERALALPGAGKISALPTVDIADPPEPEDLIAAYAGRGLRSIYLRPVNYHGFARKRFGKGDEMSWNRYYGRFIDTLIAYNATAEETIEEYYFTHCLRRVLRSGHHGHVDLRNPNVLGSDYIVVDYDGTIYPTDEARMLSRIRQADLSIGTVFEGIQSERLSWLNAASSNNFHEDCVHCVNQPYCGVDLVDDLSRYGRIDLPKHETSFCRRHMAVFGKIFDLLYSDDRSVHRSLAAWLDVPAFDPSLAPVLR